MASALPGAVSMALVFSSFLLARGVSSIFFGSGFWSWFPTVVRWRRFLPTTHSSTPRKISTLIFCFCRRFDYSEGVFPTDVPEYRFWVSQQGAKFNTCIQNFHDDSSNVEVASQVFETDGAGARQLILDGGDSELQKQLPTYVDSATVGGMESTHTPVSNLETIFSPLLEPIQMHGEVNIDNDAGGNDGPELPTFGADDSDDRSSFGSQTLF
ncbi:hypothetical protein V6N11_005377 [Hibiscus sabdariffa]|uniref:Uncharacterized protein n=1 Tax=Hibiscus sabdariffa TaxID=183260 RepID=A0ABR2RNE2_9ROSI